MNFIIALYQAALDIDLRSEVRADVWSGHFFGYNIFYGLRSGNFAGLVSNMHHFLAATGQIHNFTKGTGLGPESGAKDICGFPA